jgi:hypothetical protein
MKKLILKICLYVFLLAVTLEVFVRVSYLGRDIPNRFLDDKNVEKWEPNQNGYAITGNRRQNFSEYRINKSGFNSYREFSPSISKVEVALVGDSFIEGFHQHYYNSIGKKIENKLPGIEVYEYGYAGYDMADQLHLINAYKEQFDLIDIVILGLKFNNDLTREKYEVEGYRLALETPLLRFIKKIKVVVYARSIGFFTPIQNLLNKSKQILNKKVDKPPIKRIEDSLKHEKYIKNLEALISRYGFNKSKFYFLIDERITPDVFFDYLDNNNFKYITIGEELESSSKPTTLIYDMHWNNNGRSIVANKIVKSINFPRVKK